MTATSPLWLSEDAARATAGLSRHRWHARGVSIDTRTLVPGDLFVALVGPNHDGHDFVADALERGAAAAMVARVPAGVTDEAPLLLVADTLRGLADLGRFARDRAVARVVGVTGSVGKTGTKEALRLALGALGPTVASEGSLNNHWGLPLSLARMPAATAFAAVEMGMNHPGEIAPLSALARPHVALITAVEAVHIAHFPSVEAIADAKAEIFTGVEPGGVAVLNRDNDHFARLAAAAGLAGISRMVAFGRHADAGVRLLEARADADGTDVRAYVGGEEIAYRLNVAGAHWVANSLGVLAVVAALGGDVGRAAAALAGLEAPTGRGRRERLAIAGGAVTLIDDSYNASPASMEAAFAVLGGTAPAAGGRRVAVLGDMLELGAGTEARHQALAAPLEDAGVDTVFTAGEAMAHLFEALPAAMRGGHAKDARTLAPLVAAGLRAGDVVVVKGSAASRMGLVVDALRALARSGDNERPRAVNGE